jgi:hypothetical protein
VETKARATKKENLHMGRLVEAAGKGHVKKTKKKLTNGQADYARMTAMRRLTKDT